MVQDAFDSKVGSKAHSMNLVLLDATRPLSLDEIMAEVERRGLPVTGAPREHLYRLEGKDPKRPTPYVKRIDGYPVRWARLDLVNDSPFPDTTHEDVAVSAESDETPYELSEEDARRLVEANIRERRGQPEFRQALVERFEGRCLVTGCSTLAVLEAAHICPYRGPADNHPENGLLLRADIHTLFDLNLLGIEPNSWCVRIHPRVSDDYGDLDGIPLEFPNGRTPSVEAVEIRFREFSESLWNS